MNPPIFFLKVAKVIICLFIVVTPNMSLFGQMKHQTFAVADTVNVTMLNGDVFSGTLLKQDTANIYLATTNGEVKLLTNQVKVVEKANGSDKFRFESPVTSSYFVGPTAFQIKKKEAIYRNILLGINTLEYGLSDRFSITGGLELSTTFSGNPVWFLSAKGGEKLGKNIHAGGGVMVIGLSSLGTTGIVYGVSTFGHTNSNVSLGVGFGASSQTSAKPVILCGGLHRISNTLSLMTENYVYISGPDTKYFGIQGIRLQSKKHAFNLGLIVVPALEDMPIFPFIGYGLTF